jgi:hypothetical protein
MKHIPINLCRRIYDILVEHADAPEAGRAAFAQHYAHPDNHYKPTEYRICYRWGMAGKFWWNNDRFYVSARSWGECDNIHDFEKENRETCKVNKLLAPLYAEFESYRMMRGMLETIPSFAQYQGSVTDQLKLLIMIANKVGLRDAAAFILSAMVEKP